MTTVQVQQKPNVDPEFLGRVGAGVAVQTGAQSVTEGGPIPAHQGQQQPVDPTTLPTIVPVEQPAQPVSAPEPGTQPIPTPPGGNPAGEPQPTNPPEPTQAQPAVNVTVNTPPATPAP